MPVSRLLLALVVASGCSLVTPFSVSPGEDGGAPFDGGRDASDGEGDSGGDSGGDTGDDTGADADADTGADADATDGGLVGAGPMTFVVSGAEMLTERYADLDDDGDLDNCIADLGEETATLFAGVISVAIERPFEDRLRQLIHLPRVDDRDAVTHDSATAISCLGYDAEYPPDPSDDLSGTGSFFAASSSLDSCGEPLFYFRDVDLDEGIVDGARAASVATTEGGLLLREVRAWGNVARGGSRMDLVLSGVVLIRDLGRDCGLASVGDLSNLEVLLAGGAPFGFPALPGVTPDLDLDGDGLETFETDDEGRITRCIDGDRTVIEGRGCWADPRLADALSFATRWELISAHFAGREPGWQGSVEGECTDPPEQSLFDP